MIFRYTQIIALIFCFSFATLLFWGCDEKSLSSANYCAWIENKESGLKVNERKNGFEFTLQYKSWQYLTLKEASGTLLTQKELENQGTKYKGLQHYNLQISSEKVNVEMLRYGAKSDEEVQQRISYFSYPAQQDILLLSGKDTLPCVLYHFERSYNLSPYCQLVLGFPLDSTSSSEDKTVLYQDKLLGTGEIALHVKRESIASIPRLNLPE